VCLSPDIRGWRRLDGYGCDGKVGFLSKSDRIVSAFLQHSLSEYPLAVASSAGCLVAIAFLSVQPLLSHGEKSQVPSVTHHSTL
jgi:hypothetical protein